MSREFRNFKLGEEPPEPFHDAGSGKWCGENEPREPMTREAVTLKKYILNHLPGASFKVGMNATHHMAHFLGNTGKDYHVDVGKFMSKSWDLKFDYLYEEECAKTFAEFLPPGDHSIVAEVIGHGKFQKRLTEEWGANDLYFASNMYKYWGQADLKIKKLTEKRNECRMKFRFHFLDRYNWDDLKGTDITPKNEYSMFDGRVTVSLMANGGLRDSQMQALVRQCLAKEFDLKGVIEAESVFAYDVEK